MASKPFDALEIIESLANEAAEDVQRVGIAILSALATTTPVGNPTLWQNPASAPPGYVGGHARRNWQVSFGSFKDGEVGTAGQGGGKAAATAQAKSGNAKIKKFDRNNANQGGRLIIQNNVPYIVPLNNGHSAQAGAHFVEKAVQIGRRKGANERKDLP